MSVPVFQGRGRFGIDRSPTMTLISLGTFGVIFWRGVVAIGPLGFATPWFVMGTGSMLDDLYLRHRS